MDVIREEWLRLPDFYTEPLRMCAVNQFVHCVRSLDSRYLPNSAEYVLVGTGTSMPDHFHQWIYCMHQVIDPGNLKLENNLTFSRRSTRCSCSTAALFL